MATSSTRLLDIRVHQQTSDEQIIAWSPVGVDLASGTVDVYVRYAETDTTEELLLTVSSDSRFARLTDLQLRDKWRTVFYRLLVTDSGGDTREYDNVHLDGGRAIGPVKGLRLNVRTMLRLGGDPVLVYQRVSGKGTRCTCYDVKLKKVIRSNCDACFNTGWVTGYYPPILTLAQISPEAASNTPGDVERQTTSTEILLAEYPEVRPRDMIYEVGSGRRYRVGTIMPSEYNRQLIHQSFQATRLNPNDIEHTVPVPDPDTLDPVMARVDAPRSRRVIVVANPGEGIQDARKKI